MYCSSVGWERVSKSAVRLGKCFSAKHCIPIELDDAIGCDTGLLRKGESFLISISVS